MTFTSSLRACPLTTSVFMAGEWRSEKSCDDTLKCASPALARHPLLGEGAKEKKYSVGVGKPVWIQNFSTMPCQSHTFTEQTMSPVPVRQPLHGLTQVGCR